MDNLFDYLFFIPDWLKNIIINLEAGERRLITEIRIRRNKPIIIYLSSSPYFISKNDKLINHYNSSVRIIDDYEFGNVINLLFNSSFHSYVDTLVKGYVTTKDGLRVGVSSTAVNMNGEIKTVKDVSSLNIRIPGEYKNCSRKILNELYVNNLPSIIIAGAPSAGKTTVLRDMAYLLSSGFAGKYRKVSLIDERRELSFGIETGINTDVLCSFRKAEGIEMAIRTLSPDIIICDEIGNEEELRSIKQGFDCGVSFAVSVHASSLNDIITRPLVNSMLATGQFDYIIHLKDYTRCLDIYSIDREKIIENCRSCINYDIHNIFG